MVDLEDKKPVTGSSWVSVSTMSNTDPEIETNNKTVFDWCKEGDVKQVSQQLKDKQIDVNSLDESVGIFIWRNTYNHCKQ